MQCYLFFILAISCLSANVDPPDLFHYNQGTYQAFYFFTNVTIDSMRVDLDDWVGTFNCTEWNEDSTACAKLGTCVGSRKWDVTKCGGGVCDLPAMGTGGETSEKTIGYLNTDEFPVFLIYDKSHDVYYKTEPDGDVKLQKELCRNGYPYCYGWENLGIYFVDKLVSKNIHMDCIGKLGGDKVLDECGICGGSGPRYTCEKTGVSYCTEAKYQMECLSE